MFRRSEVTHIAVVVFASFAALAVVISPGVRGADDKETGTKLSLSSGYGYGLLWDKARSVWRAMSR